MSLLKTEGLFKQNLEINLSPGFALIFPNGDSVSFLNVKT